MIKLSPCDHCKNRTGMAGWLPSCKAFPDGIPYDFEDEKAKELNECNNGFKYEPEEDQD